MPTTKPASAELKAAWIAHRDAEEAWKAEMQRLDPYWHSRLYRDDWSKGKPGTTLRTLWEALQAAKTRWEVIAGRD